MALSRNTIERSQTGMAAFRALPPLCPAPAEVAGAVCSSSLLPVRARRAPFRWPSSGYIRVTAPASGAKRELGQVRFVAAASVNDDLLVVFSQLVAVGLDGRWHHGKRPQRANL